MRYMLVSALSVFVLSVPAPAAPQASARTMPIRLVSTTVSSKLEVDQAPKGTASKGDVVWARSLLRNAVPQFGKPNRAHVGRDVEVLTLVSASVGEVKVTATLPGGTIRATGRISASGPDTQTIRVTGGTGVFANARGSCAVTQASGNQALNVYRLQLPT